jgi:rRNA maturation endonuclease Nob1
MLATILKSPQATQTTLAIIETFAKIKSLSQTIKEVSNTEDDKQKQTLLEKSGRIIAELLDDDFQTTEAETTIELNFAVLKFKHTIKSKKL